MHACPQSSETGAVPALTEKAIAMEYILADLYDWMCLLYWSFRFDPALALDCFLHNDALHFLLFCLPKTTQ